MKKCKATGRDEIPAEVWRYSPRARELLFKFLRKVWQQEEVPRNLVLCVFVLIYKNKGSPDDCSKYRAIGLLNHSYKIMSVVLLKRLMRETKDFLK